jgi:ABC-type antimicrobial peptide transport system permease subunit
MDKFYYKIFSRRFKANFGHYLLKILILILGISALGIISAKIDELNSNLSEYSSESSNIFRIVDANQDNPFLKGIVEAQATDISQTFEKYAFFEYDEIALEIAKLNVIRSSTNFIDINNLNIDYFDNNTTNDEVILINQKFMDFEDPDNAKIVDELKLLFGRDIRGTFDINYFSYVKDIDILIIEPKFSSNTALFSLRKSQLNRKLLNKLYGNKNIEIDKYILTYIEEIINDVSSKDTFRVEATLPYYKDFGDVVKTPAIIGEKLTNHEDITSYLRLSFDKISFKNQNTEIIFADENVFEYFNIPVKKYNKISNNFAYISKSLSQELNDKNIEIHGINYQIAGVFNDLPKFFDFSGDMILDVKPFLEQEQFINPYDYSVYTYVKIKEGSSFRRISQDVAYWLQTEKPRSRSKLQFQPIVEANFNPAGKSKSRKDIYFLTALYTIAILILLSAAIGYTILTIIEYPKRSGELGIRKLGGAKTVEIFLTNLIEALFFGFIAFNLSIISKMGFELLTNTQGNTTGLNIYLIMLLSTLIICVISSFLPTIYLNKLKLRDALSDNVSKLNKSLFFRDFVIGFQLSLSMTIIIFAFISNDQIDFLKQQKLTYSQDHYLYFNVYEEPIISKINNIKDIDAENKGDKIIVTISSHKFWGKIAELENVWKNSANNDFNPVFIENDMNDLYQYEKTFADLIEKIIIVVIIISLISIYSISRFLNEERKEEFGIRKIYGASFAQIFKIQIFEFIRLLFVSIIITFMLSFFPINTWLMKFDVSISISFYPYLISFIGAFIILSLIIITSSMNVYLKKPIFLIRE